MKVGDAVKHRIWRKDGNYVVYPTKFPNTIGIISDIMEMDDGHSMYEVIFEHDRGWFSDLELEVISEG